jgi:hypothetical protein
LWVFSHAHGGGLRYELKAKEAAILPRGFKLGDDGLWFHNQDEDAPRVKVCGPFSIEARTSVSDDTHNNHGLLLKWTDPDRKPHKWPMPIQWVHADGNAHCRRIAQCWPALRHLTSGA